MIHLPQKLVVLSALALASVSLARAANDNYIRVSALEVVPEAHTSDDATGVMVALGTTFDNRFSDTANQFELEVGWAKWDDSATAVIGGVTYSGKADLTFIPVLFTYRYQWNFGDRFSLAVGPSVGASHLRAEGSASGGGISGSVSDTDWVFSCGVGVQINYRISDAVALTAGYRYLMNQNATFSAAGAKVELKDLDTHLFELGLRIEWPLD